MTSENMEFDFGEEPTRFMGFLWAAGFLVLVGAASFAGWYYLIRDEAAPTVSLAQQPVEVSTGQIVSSFVTTGTAEADLSADLSFGTGGTIRSVEVSLGDVVAEGDVIAQLETVDAIAAIASAEANLEIAELQLASLLEGPNSSSQTSAAQSVTNALNSVANAEEQLASAEQALADAYLGPTENALQAADNAITQAESALLGAENQEESAWAGLTFAHNDYCTWYSGSAAALPCNHNGIGSDIPLDESEIVLLTESLIQDGGNNRRSRRLRRQHRPSSLPMASTRAPP